MAIITNEQKNIEESKRNALFDNSSPFIEIAKLNSFANVFFDPKYEISMKWDSIKKEFFSKFEHSHGYSGLYRIIRTLSHKRIKEMFNRLQSPISEHMPVGFFDLKKTVEDVFNVQTQGVAFFEEVAYLQRLYKELVHKYLQSDSINLIHLEDKITDFLTTNKNAIIKNLMQTPKPQYGIDDSLIKKCSMNGAIGEAARNCLFAKFVNFCKNILFNIPAHKFSLQEFVVFHGKEVADGDITSLFGKIVQP